MRNKQRQLKIKEKNKKGFKSTDLPNKINELKQIIGRFPGNPLNSLINDRLKEIVEEKKEIVQKSIKINDLESFIKKKEL